MAAAEASRAERLRRLLEERGVAWPAPIEHFESLGSTSDRLKERAREGAPEWTVVTADRQTSGRGRQGHAWASPPGNAYASLLLRPSVAARRLTLLPLAAGLAVAEALEGFGVAAGLKWPNDVLAGGRKLAGVLVEAVSSGGGLESVILGIGVNVAADAASLPPDVRPHATSVLAETRRAVEALEVTAAVLARMTVWYHAVAERPRSVVDSWRTRSVPWWGRRVEVRSGGETLRGIARDVDDRGALVLETDEGGRVCVLSGEARELRLS